MKPVLTAFPGTPVLPYLPQGYCIAWDPWLLTLQWVSEGLVALAYISIPLSLLLYRLRAPRPRHAWALWLGAVALLAGAAAHALNIVTLYEPLYWVQTWVKAAAAAAAIVLAALLWLLALRLSARHAAQGASEAAAETTAGRDAPPEERIQELEHTAQALRDEVAEHKRQHGYKDELVATVGHELRTPLTSIGGSLHLLASNTEITRDEQRELAGIAMRNIQRMIRLINTMLDIDRLETGADTLRATTVSMSDLARTAIQDNTGFAKQYGVGLKLVGTPAPGLVRGDADRLLQVLTNLISNASKHAPRGTEVEIAVEERGGIVRTSVSDRGPGIPLDERERVFDKFVRVRKSDASHTEGFGLGLSIARAIVTRHRGRIGLQDGPAGGTTFYVEIPASGSDAAK